MNATHTLNKIFAGALLSGGLSLFAAGSLAAAPVAKADIDFECKPGCWGALAASPSNGQEEMVTNATTQQKAEDKAVLWCDVLGETKDCYVVTSGLGCLSLAESTRARRLMRRLITSRGPSWPLRTAVAGCVRRRSRR